MFHGVLSSSTILPLKYHCFAQKKAFRLENFIILFVRTWNNSEESKDDDEGSSWNGRSAWSRNGGHSFVINDCWGWALVWKNYTRSELIWTNKNGLHGHMIWKLRNKGTVSTLKSQQHSFFLGGRKKRVNKQAMFFDGTTQKENYNLYLLIQNPKKKKYKWYLEQNCSKAVFRHDDLNFHRFHQIWS